MRSTGGYYSQFSDEQEESLAVSKQISENKRLVVSDVRDLWLSTSNDLRDKEAKWSVLKNKFIKIANNLRKAVIGVDRLRNPVSETQSAVSPRLDLQRLMDTLVQTIKSNKNTGYLLNRVRRSLDEVATVAELVANTIKSKLADKHKKLAALKELGLRLRDIDELLIKAEEAMSSEEADQKQILNSIQELLHTFGIKLPVDLEEVNIREKLIQAIETNREKLRKHQPLGEVDLAVKSKNVLGDILLVAGAALVTSAVLKFMP